MHIDLLVSLILEGNFPNETMQANWYGGNVRIRELSIKSPKLKIIENNAFARRAFYSLDVLTLIASYVVVQSDMGQGLGQLKFFNLKHSFGGPDMTNMLNPMQKTLEYFTYECLVVNTTFNFLNILLGSVRLSALETVQLIFTIRRAESNGAILAARNFSRLTKLKSLRLIRCGIVAILDGTFDSVGMTLETIDLSGNQLSKLTADLFRVFFDINFNLHKKTVKSLTTYGNLMLLCDNEFYKLRNISLIASGWFTDNYKFLRCRQEVLCNETTPIANDTQLIDITKWHLNHSHADLQIYAYINFQLKLLITNVSLLVKQLAPHKFRLLTVSPSEKIHQRNPKCLAENNVKCLVFYNAIEEIPIGDFIKNSELTLFCIIYISINKHVWPLHCITVRRPPPMMENMFSWTHSPTEISLVFVSSITGIILGLFVRFAFLLHQRKKFEE